MLVFIVIFFPESVTAFLDKEKIIDLDSVTIEAPPDESATSPAMNGIPGVEPKGANGALVDPAAAAATDAAAAKKAEDDEQKKLDDLFKK
jgi:hypothetical protein